MAKTENKPAAENPGDQGVLIDIEPENAQKIARVARDYKAAVKARMKLGAKELELKHKLLEVVREAKIAPDTDGSYRFHVGDVLIIVEPRDELVKVKFDDESADK